ncbi:MAG: hypothetical protein IJZ44_01100 [Lachnospiraceae bacterium]|nr:hypothetical protein [Lachnospiraceae bacterium]
MKKSLPQKLHIILLSILLFLFTTFLFTGCAEYTASNESEKKISSYEEAGSQIMTDYLDENISDATLTSCVCYEVYDGNYRYITDYVEGYFDVDGISYFYRANIKTGEVYTGYYDEEIGNLVGMAIAEELALDYVYINDSYISKIVPATEDESLDSYEFKETVSVSLPGYVDEDNLETFIEDIFNGNDYSIHITLAYNDAIRIEDMDLNHLSEEYPNVCLSMYHKASDADITMPTNLALIEELYLETGDHYRYTSYNQKTAHENILVVYEEYTCDGGEAIDIFIEDPIKPDNFTIDIDDSQICIDLETNTNYYLCFSDLSLLDGEDLYYYLDTTDDYTKVNLKEDFGYYYSSSYYGGQRPINQSEIFYIGHPEE